MKKLSELTREEADEILMGEPGTTVHGVTIASSTDKPKSDSRSQLDPRPEPPPEEKPADQLQVNNAAMLRPQPVTWLWKDWLPEGMLTIVAGQQAQGKTTMCMGIAATVSSGGRFPDGAKPKQGNVLIWSGEDIPEIGLIPKLIAMGADLKHIYFVGDMYSKGEKITFQPANHMDALLRSIENIGNVKLLIIDPIVSAVGGDDHKNNDVRRALQPIIDAAAISGMAVIGITHYRKGSAENAAIERVMGSLAYTAAARSVWCVGRQENSEGKSENILVRAKSSYSINGGGFKYTIQGKHLKKENIHTTEILWGEYIEGNPDDLLIEQSDNDKENISALDKAKEFIVEYLTDITPSDDFMKDAMQAGISKRTMIRARDELGVEAKKSDGKWYLRPGEKIRRMRHILYGDSLEEKQECQAHLSESQDVQGGKLGTLGTLDKNQQLTEHKKSKNAKDAKNATPGEIGTLEAENGGKKDE